MFTKWLQDTFNVPLVIQISDDEKFLFNEKIELEDCIQYGKNNVKELLSLGFDRELTFVFSDVE
jgi:tryptophanyl-tRNA synthetase